jgi:hypothetical protein
LTEAVRGRGKTSNPSKFEDFIAVTALFAQ